MFGGLFERGSRSFSTILLLAALALVFFSQYGGIGPMRSTAAGTDKKDDEDTAEQNDATILYSRVVGKEAEVPKKRVLEAVVLEKPETTTKVLFSRTIGKAVEEEPYKVLYSRSLEKKEKVQEKKVLEAVAEEKPETKAQVLFSRTLRKAVKEEKPYNVLYSRSLGTTEI